jgi:limonene-1,2-epoxide hydrolase
LGREQERAVKTFIAECEGEWDAARVDRILGHMADDARYHVYAWTDPLVGCDAIRGELLRQAPFMRPFHCEIVTIGSAGDVVFTERLDSLVADGKPMTLHIAGVFEIDADGKIAVWRDYIDQGEVDAKARAGSR